MTNQPVGNPPYTPQAIHGVTLPLFPPEKGVALTTAQIDALRQSSVVAVDVETETNAMGRVPSKDFGLSFSAPVTVIAFAWRSPNGGLERAVASSPEGDYGADVQEVLEYLFSKAVAVMHNAVFDYRALAKVRGQKGMHAPYAVWDTAVMERLLRGTPHKRYSLQDTVRAWDLPDVPDWYAAMKARRKSLHDLPSDQVLAYGAEDAALALRVYEKQRALPATAELEDLIAWECRAMREYCRMAAEGVAINTEMLSQRIKGLRSRQRVLADALMRDGLGNLGSPAQRADYIYTRKGVPKPPPTAEMFYTAGGSLATSGAVLDVLARDHPSLTDLKVWMETDRLLATLEGLQDHAASDGCVHSLVTIGTETGRRASSHPNLQNLMMVADHNDPDGHCAGILRGREGFTLVEIDYSNAENWIAAMLSGDDALAAACASSDFHSSMAASYFPKEWRSAQLVGDKDTLKRLRQMGKAVTFGTAYGMGAAKLAHTLGITPQAAAALLQTKDEGFRRVASLRRKLSEDVAATKSVALWTGRTVPVSPDRAFTAWNYCCQGGVGEMVKRAIVVISEYYRRNAMRSRVALDMHDAIILEVAHAEWDTALAAATEIMAGVVPQSLLGRTNPPIRFTAVPDVAGNALKWGRGQPSFPYPPENAAEDGDQ